MKLIIQASDRDDYLDAQMTGGKTEASNSLIHSHSINVRAPSKPPHALLYTRAVLCPFCALAAHCTFFFVTITSRT